MDREKLIEAVGRAIYESHQFKKPWDHPDTQRGWLPCLRKEAIAAIAAYERLAKPRYRVRAPIRRIETAPLGHVYDSIQPSALLDLLSA